MATLPDGTYDVVVVDAEETEEGDVRIELTVTLGAHVGRIVTLRRHHPRTGPDSARDPLELLGVAGTLRVRHGRPSFAPERP